MKKEIYVLFFLIGVALISISLLIPENLFLPKEVIRIHGTIKKLNYTQIRGKQREPIRFVRLNEYTARFEIISEYPASYSTSLNDSLWLNIAKKDSSKLNENNDIYAYELRGKYYNEYFASKLSVIDSPINSYFIFFGVISFCIGIIIYRSKNKAT